MSWPRDRPVVLDTGPVRHAFVVDAQHGRLETPLDNAVEVISHGRASSAFPWAQPRLTSGTQ
eukprot:3958722-Alexandrium_andersonii.AAC.1